MANSFGRLSGEIFLTKKKLNEINSKKEELYKKKEELRTKLLDLRQKIKELKELKKEYTENIDKLMEDRNATLERIRKLKEELRTLRAKKRSIMKNKTISQDINKVRKELETLEYVLQTEVLSYTQERKIWNRIKYLRKILGKYEELSVVLNEIDEKQAELDAYVSKLTIIRENIRRNIEERKKIRAEMEKLINELVSLKEEYNKIREQILEYKKQIKELNDHLKELLEKYVSMLRNRKQSDIDLDISNVDEVIQKYNAVQEKIMNGEEINTEDILILQKYEILKSKGIIK